MVEYWSIRATHPLSFKIGIAHQRLEKKEIAAEIINCDRKQAYLISLVENIARIPPKTMWFAREVQRMRDAGMSINEICRIVGKSHTHVSAYLRLADRGEERLIKGVEQGVFPMDFAIKVAETHSSQIQHLLMDAFDEGLITSHNLRSVRRIINSRFKTYPEMSNPRQGPAKPRYSVSQLKQDIAKVCREKEAFVREAGIKEGRVISLLEGLATLRGEKAFITLIEKEGLAEMPQLHSMNSA